MGQRPDKRARARERTRNAFKQGKALLQYLARYAKFVNEYEHEK